MPKIEYRLFGYRRIKSEEGKEARLATHLLGQDIAAEFEPDGTFVIRERDFRRFRRYAGGRIRYTVSEPLGIPGAIWRNLVHIPTAVAVLVGILINILLAGVVWDVRISGNERVESEKIVEALDEAGFGVGSIWSLYDKEATETALLRGLNDISWVSINRRGAVAYVEVKETADIPDKDTAAYPCSNIVAAADCIIEEINVRHGRALVKVGDAVKRGDILISGIIESESGTYFTRAEGSVRAHIAKSAAVEVGEVEEVTEYDTSRVYARYVNIFGLSINIFKNYGNLPEDCAIIDDEVVWTASNGAKMPVSLLTEYMKLPVVTTVGRARSELPGVAAARLEAEVAAIVGEGDLIKLKTDGEYTTDGYRMTATIVVSAEVGREVKVDVTE